MCDSRRPLNGADSLTDDQYRAEPTVAAWSIGRPDDEGRYFVTGLTKEQAEYGAMLLNEEALGDDPDASDVLEAVDTIECVYCHRPLFAAQALPEAQICQECAG